MLECMNSQSQLLRDRDGRRIGEIETSYDGIQILRDRDGRRLGEYNPQQNITRDRDGRRIGEGNLVVTLL